MAGCVQDGVPLVGGLEVRAAHVHRLALGALLLVQVEHVRHPPRLLLVVLGVLFLLLDGALVHLARDQHDTPAHGRFATVHMPNEDYVRRV